MSELHASRSQGKYRKGPRKVAPAPALLNNAWPDFWNQEAESAFIQIKKLAVDAVSLHFPDFEGASSGTNPYHLYVDACDFGVGGGLFQCQKNRTDEGPCHYSVLGVPKWGTKRDVILAYNAKKKSCKSYDDGRSVSAEVEKAFEILGDIESRKAYDIEKGDKVRQVASKSLVPLALHSKSLNSTQRGWNTWERELFEVIEFLNAHSSMLTGMHVIIHTDHLNSTLLNAVLQYPDKILRMLLKIEAKCVATWQFGRVHESHWRWVQSESR